jgi:hypothetical protein
MGGMVMRIVAMPAGAARLSTVGCEDDHRGDRKQSEYANPHQARGSPIFAKHEIPVPSFRLDHPSVGRNCALGGDLPPVQASRWRSLRAMLEVQLIFAVKILSSNSFFTLT